MEQQQQQQQASASSSAVPSSSGGSMSITASASFPLVDLFQNQEQQQQNMPSTSALSSSLGKINLMHGGSSSSDFHHLHVQNHHTGVDGFNHRGGHFFQPPAASAMPIPVTGSSVAMRSTSSFDGSNNFYFPVATASRIHRYPQQQHLPPPASPTHGSQLSTSLPASSTSSSSSSSAPSPHLQQQQLSNSNQQQQQQHGRNLAGSIRTPLTVDIQAASSIGPQSSLASSSSSSSSTTTSSSALAASLAQHQQQQRFRQHRTASFTSPGGPMEMSMSPTSFEGPQSAGLLNRHHHQHHFPRSSSHHSHLPHRPHSMYTSLMSPLSPATGIGGGGMPHSAGPSSSSFSDMMDFAMVAASATGSPALTSNSLQSSPHPSLYSNAPFFDSNHNNNSNNDQRIMSSSSSMLDSPELIGKKEGESNHPRQHQEPTPTLTPTLHSTPSSLSHHQHQFQQQQHRHAFQQQNLFFPASLPSGSNMDASSASLLSTSAPSSHMFGSHLRNSMDAFNSVLMNNQGGVDEQNGESGNGSLSLDGLESSNNNSTSSSGSGGSSASFPARYRCACGKLFQKLCGLKSHIKVHQAQGARLSVNDAGELEWLTESGMPVIAKAEEVCRNHVCDICSRSFLRKQDLRRHKSTHLSVSKRFKCENCDTTFSRSDALFRHTKSMRCRE